jgi:predicted RNA binding protein YcfA (HicA-like mRNA interferase family)
VKAAEERGWVHSRTTGSHSIWWHDGWPDHVAIPFAVKGSGTKRAIIDQLLEEERSHDRTS